MPTHVTGEKTPFAFAMDFHLGEIALEKSKVVNVIWFVALESGSHASSLLIVDEE